MGAREIAEPASFRQARTLPAAWYSSPYHHQRELRRVWAAQWVCIGDAQEAAPDFGSLGAPIDAVPPEVVEAMEAMEAMEVVLSERDERSFNWKLLIENHSENYDRGTALTVFPNLMLNVFPDAALAMWVEPLSINRTVVHRRMYARNGTDRDAVAASIAAHRLVHAQDIASCLRVQDSHDAGVDGDGVLGPVEERVFRLHERLRGLLAIP